MKQILFAWSGGKDSAMALHEIRKDPEIEVVALLTTVTRDYDHVSMHGVRCELIDKQAESIGLPLEKVFISVGASNDDYEAAMRETLERYNAKGVTAVAFGDIFLEDLKKYREDKLAQVGMTTVFPIWKRDTSELAREFIALGFNPARTLRRALGRLRAGNSIARFWPTCLITATRASRMASATRSSMMVPSSAS